MLSLRPFVHFLFTLSLLTAERIYAGESGRSGRIAGPVAAELIRVIDGDTLMVNAAPWPEHYITTYVRLRGIDAPELRSRCDGERRAAKRAMDALSKLVSTSPGLSLANISGDKYYGRVLADIQLADGRSAGQELLASGLVEPYDGGRKSKRSCQ